VQVEVGSVQKVLGSVQVEVGGGQAEPGKHAELEFLLSEEKTC
jgi:hypothetical protein